MPKYTLEDDLVEVSLPNGRKVKINAQNLKDYQDNVRRANNPTVLPEVTVNAKKVDKHKKISLKDINWDASSPEAQAKIQDSRDKDSHWYDYGIKNFKDTFGVNPRSVADWIPGVGDVLALGDVSSALKDKRYKEAALAAGMFVLPNVIEKPIKGLYKYGKNTIRKLNRNYKYNPFQYFEGNLITEAIRNDNEIRLNKYLDRLKTDETYFTGKDINFIKDAISKSLDNNTTIADKVAKHGLNQKQLDDYYKNLVKYDFIYKYPAYNRYVVVNGLNPNDTNTIRKFINNQSHAIRGVYTKGEGEDYIKFLTYADNKENLARRGGDMFNSRGLYTSNATQVSNKFDKAINDPNTKGYTAKLYHDFEINPNLSIDKQLEQLQDRIFEYGILDDIKNIGIYIDDYDKFRMNNPDIHAWESPYFGTSVKQRAYINSTDIPSKPVANIIDLTESSQGGTRTERFGLNNSPTEELFIAQYPINTEHNLKRYTDLINKNQRKSLTEEGKILKEYKQQKLIDYYNKNVFTQEHKLKRANILKQRKMKINKTLGKINDISIFGFIGGGTATALSSSMTYEKQKYNTNEINEMVKMSDKDFNKLYNDAMKDKNMFSEDYINNIIRANIKRHNQNKERKTLEN